jgi:3-hydroxyisobutyrate dehydrogenase-like beta-hydroxyacid dehydrogenase
MAEAIGVAGCGAMGLPMAKRLALAGFEVFGFDVRPVSDFGDFAPRMIADPAAFAARCMTVFSVVRDERQTNDLLFESQAIFAREHRPKRLVICSTVSPRALHAVAARLPKDTVLVDAPMSGAPYRAEAGTLTFMVGGAEDVVAALMPAFRAMGTTIHHLGPFGAGMTCKVVNNFVAASSVVAVRRALAAAHALGVDPARLLEVMRTSSGATWYGDNFEKIAWAREGYDPSNTIGILEKDVTSFLDALTGVGADTTEDFASAVLAGLRRAEPLA